jgi:hypothetical protein
VRAIAGTLTTAYESAVRRADDEDNGAEAETEPVPVAVPAVAPATQSRGPKPLVQMGQPIHNYSRSQLATVVRWIESDGCLRTDDEIVSEAMRALGFMRRGPNIVAAIKNAISYSRQ